MNCTLHCLRWLLMLALGAGIPVTSLAAADPEKVLHLAFEAADDGFDLIKTNSVYSNWLAEGVFESLLAYDYLARPAKLMPGTAEAMPEVSEDGKTYLLRIKKGIFFTPDAAFKGQARELVANDYAYAIKRHLDPKNRSVQAGVYTNRIVGLDALAAEAKKTGRFDYDKPIAGFEMPDKYTLRIRLVAPDQLFPYHLANAVSGAVAREVVELYGEDVGRHPVGTGPYMLKKYVPRSKIVLEANPAYRSFTWDFKAGSEAVDEKIVRTMKGKQMPQIGRVEINIIEEEQARWLAFSTGQLDLALLSDPAAPKVLEQGKLKPEYLAKGLSLYRFAEPGTTRTFFNFRDPLVGGFTPEKIALRRAIAMAYDFKTEIAQVRHGQSVKAQSFVPPGVAGFDASYRNSIAYDPALASKLLDHFGYRRGDDGFRTLPDGKPLTLKIHSAPSSRDQAIMEIWKKSLDKIGLRAEFPVSGFADNLKAAYRCELMMWGVGGTASIPDGSDFLESFYGPNSEQGNLGCYRSPKFDEAYEKARLLPDGPERQQLYTTMERLLEADTAMVLGLWRLRNWMIQPWVQGYKTHPILRGDWKYLDIEKR